jgi:hypothetical protein
MELVQVRTSCFLASCCSCVTVWMNSVHPSRKEKKIIRLFCVHVGTNFSLFSAQSALASLHKIWEEKFFVFINFLSCYRFPKKRKYFLGVYFVFD